MFEGFYLLQRVELILLIFLRRCSKTPGDSKAEKMEEDDKLPESHLLTSAEPDSASCCAAGEGQARTWWRTDVAERAADSGSSPRSPSGRSRWDFAAIPFPDLGSTGRPICAGPPDPSLLPRDVTPGVCDVASWMRRINLRKVKMSAEEEQREERRRRQRDVNKDMEVKPSERRSKAEKFTGFNSRVFQVQRCRNWAEYHELLARRQAKRQGRPDHLWNGEVKPLHDPTQPITTGEAMPNPRLLIPKPFKN